MRLAVVLFNLGAPDGPAAVRPFLVNLFSDAAIINVANPVRWILARMIARRRARVAGAIYEALGGGSPLLPNTEAQAKALGDALAGSGETRLFVCMRHWHPMSEAVARQVHAFAPDRIVLLPLYPQFSTTTSGSSLRAWQLAAAACGLDRPTSFVCCYPTEPGLIAALATRIRASCAEAAARRPDLAVRVLYSAHGLPKRIVARGDPYQAQVEATAAAVSAGLGLVPEQAVVCYQSRVGPLEWIGPSTESEIERAGRDGVAVALAPIAFVSEHSETLYELDIQYGALALEAGVPLYLRVGTVGTDADFIAGLARLVRAAAAEERAVRSGDGGRICAAGQRCCVNKPAAAAA